MSITTGHLDGHSSDALHLGRLVLIEESSFLPFGLLEKSVGVPELSAFPASPTVYLALTEAKGVQSPRCNGIEGSAGCCCNAPVL